MRFLKQILALNGLVIYLCLIAFSVVGVGYSGIYILFKIPLVATLIFGGIGLLNHVIYGRA